MKLSCIIALAFATLASGERFLQTKRDEGLKFDPESMILKHGRIDEFLYGKNHLTKGPRDVGQSFDVAPILDFFRKLLTHPSFPDEDFGLDKRSLEYDDIGDPIEDADVIAMNDEPVSAEVYTGPLNEYGASNVANSNQEYTGEKANEFGELKASHFEVMAEEPDPASDPDTLIDAYLSKVSEAEIEDLIQECAKLETAFNENGIKFDDIYCSASFNPVAKTKLLANEELFAKANALKKKLQSYKLEVAEVFCFPELTF